MLNTDQLTTIRAALRFWQDEIVPGGKSLSALYYDMPTENELDRDQIDALIECLQPERIRYALISPDDNVLAVTRVPRLESDQNRNATLVFGPATIADD